MSDAARAASQALLALVLAGLLGVNVWLGACTALAAALVFPPAAWRPLGLARALACYGVWLVLWVAFAAAYLRVMRAVGHPVAPQGPLQALAERGVTLPSFWLEVTVIVCVAPVVEEVIFRGYLFASVCRAVPAWLAQLIVAALFGLAHGLEHALPIGVLSLVFGYLRGRSGALAPSMFVHALHNGLTVSAVVCWPGLLDLLYAR